MRRATMVFVVLAASFTWLLAMTAPASAAVVSAQADAYVENMYGNTDTNFGGEAVLLAKYESAFDADRKAYIRFDVSSLTTPADDYILGLNVVNSGRGAVNPTQVYEFVVYGLEHGVGEGWLQSGITWNNAPANASKNLFTGGATSLGTFSITGTGAGSTISFSNPAMAAFIESDTDDEVTFMIARNTSGGGGSYNYIHAFASMESTIGGPTLEAVYSGAMHHAPEPGTVIIWSVLGVLGIGGGWWRRRRRAA